MSQFNDIIEVYQFSQFFCLTLNDKIFILFVNLFSLITTKSQRLSHANTKHLLFANYFCHIVLPIDTKKEERRFRGIKLEWGYDKVIPLKPFKDASNGYLVDDMCVFGAEVFVSKQRSMDKGECLELIKESITNKFVFRIENYSKLTADFYDSNSFNVGLYKWYLFLNYDQLSWLSATPSVCLCVRDIYADCQIYMHEIPEVNTPFMLIVAGRYGSVPMEKALDGAAIIL